MNETEALHILMHLPKVYVRKLVAHFGSASAALQEISWERTDSWKKDRDLVEKEGITLISYADRRYPNSLKDLSDFPLLLYVKGGLREEDDGGLAIVGTRNCSMYGLEMAEQLAQDVASSGLTVVSGLARGIDTAAHVGALKSGRTVAFIGSGFSHVYPKENIPLAESIARQGCVISELPMATPPERRHFPRRNRLVSAFSQGILLVEAPIKSGAMITMEMAELQGKHCFALPGRADLETFRGNHFLIKKQKAMLVENAEEMVSILLPGAHCTPQKDNSIIELTAEERLLIDHFPVEEIGIEALNEKTRMTPAKLNALLMGLVLKRAIREFPGKYYKKVGSSK